MIKMSRVLLISLRVLCKVITCLGEWLGENCTTAEKSHGAKPNAIWTVVSIIFSQNHTCTISASGFCIVRGNSHTITIPDNHDLPRANWTAIIPVHLNGQFTVCIIISSSSIMSNSTGNRGIWDGMSK